MKLTDSSNQIDLSLTIASKLRLETGRWPSGSIHHTDRIEAAEEIERLYTWLDYIHHNAHDPVLAAEEALNGHPAPHDFKPCKTEVLSDLSGEKDARKYIVAQLLRLFALCREGNIYLPDLYREAESIADPERG